jgi:hypothetical protein
MNGSQSLFTEEFEFFSTPHGDYRVQKTRFMYKSVDRDGKDLLFGATPEAVHACTPVHLRCHKLDIKAEHSYTPISGDL